MKEPTVQELEQNIKDIETVLRADEAHCELSEAEFVELNRDLHSMRYTLRKMKSQNKEKDATNG